VKANKRNVSVTFPDAINPQRVRRSGANANLRTCFCGARNFLPVYGQKRDLLVEKPFWRADRLIKDGSIVNRGLRRSRKRARARVTQRVVQQPAKRNKVVTRVALTYRPEILSDHTTDVSSRARCTCLVAMMFAVLFLPQANSGYRRPAITTKEQSTPKGIRIVDQNGQPVSNGVPSATSQIFDVMVGQGFAFVPNEISINAGDTVRWTWVSSGHSVTSGAPYQLRLESSFR
jgi:hypothetical protein